MAMQFDVKATTVTATGSAVGYRTRVKGLIVTPTATAGSVVLKDGGSGGTTEIDVRTTTALVPFSVMLPQEGVLFETDVYAVLTDVAAVTVIYG